MRAHIAKYLNAIRYSYWFVPTLMALAACALAFGTSAVDIWLGDDWTAGLGWLAFETPAGARAILSTIAGSMITVAGVTFSITVAAVAYATSQLGPRLLGNFMRDTGNQVTLGSFIATFVYCLLVLRTVRGDGDSAGAAAFVPHLGVLVALALTALSLGVLIYFIHHTPMSIQASQVVAQIGRELLDKVDETFPDPVGEGPDPTPSDQAEPPPDGQPLCAADSGYIVHRDDGSLVALACRHDAMLHLVRRPGDFVGEGELLGRVSAGEALPDEALHALARCFAVGSERTQMQDILLVVQQLVEVAARALSPGVNDPFTAMRCLDWLGSALIRTGRRQPPADRLYDDDGVLRAVAPVLDFRAIASAALDELRPYACADRNAALHMMAVIGRVLDNLDHPAYRDVLLEHAAAVDAGAREGLAQRRDVRAVGARYQRIAARHGGAG